MLRDQAERLIHLGVHEIDGFSAAELRAETGGAASADGLLVLRPDRVPASALAPLSSTAASGFVFVDMPDVDSFSSIGRVALPASAAYRIEGLDRGDHMANCSPTEALPSIVATGRTSLTVAEGMHWLSLDRPAGRPMRQTYRRLGPRRRRLRSLREQRESLGSTG